MKKPISIILSILGVIILAVIAAGIYKFNYLSGKDGYDVDGNRIVSTSVKTEGSSKIYTDNTPDPSGEDFEKVSLKVEKNKVYMNGVIATSTPDLFKKVFSENTQINTLIMEKVDGSVDDEANLKLAKWIAKKGLTFVLYKDGDIASGGTDFFLAGKKRIVYQGAKVGVHSWAEEGNGKTAKDYPRDSKVHQSYIDYYKAIGWSDKNAKKFYFFTIDSATAKNIHYMTDEEIVDYKITTEGKIRQSS